MARVVLVIFLMLQAACAAFPQDHPDILILGEQHDAPAHQRLHSRTVQDLAARGELGGLAIEMADLGHSTAGLAKDAGDEQVRAALAWDETGWHWADYGPAVMAAVRAGVPVAGANAPRERLRAFASDASVESTVPAAALRELIDDVRAGHCGLLPESQLLPMARMQIARDREMARVAQSLASPGKTVVLIAGAHHADPQAGVPLHVAKPLRVASRLWPPQPPKEDYCAQLRRQWETRGSNTQ